MNWLTALKGVSSSTLTNGKPSIFSRHTFGRTYTPLQQSSVLRNRIASFVRCYAYNSAPWGERRKVFRHQESQNRVEKFESKFKGGPYICTGYHTATEYKINSFEELKKFFGNSDNCSLKILGDIIHVSYMEDFDSSIEISEIDSSEEEVEKKPSEMRRDVFYFTKEGCVVCWGTSPIEDNVWKNKIKTFEIETFPNPIEERIKYLIGGYTSVINDRVILDEKNSELENMEQKLAFSYAIVRSLKLEIVESLLEAALLRLIDIPKQLEMGKFPKASEWQHIVGEQIKIRGKLNFYSPLLESPDMFWDRVDLEEKFAKMQANLDIPHRISIINKRLDYSQHVVEVIRSYVNDRHSHHLERIIILLIMIEVLFYIMDKSESWRDFTFESAFVKLFGKEEVEDEDGQQQQRQ